MKFTSSFLPAQWWNISHSTEQKATRSCSCRGLLLAGRLCMRSNRRSMIEPILTTFAGWGTNNHGTLYTHAHVHTHTHSFRYCVKLVSCVSMVPLRILPHDLREWHLCTKFVAACLFLFATMHAPFIVCFFFLKKVYQAIMDLLPLVR
jgi:hypothetical protein